MIPQVVFDHAKSGDNKTGTGCFRNDKSGMNQSYTVMPQVVFDQAKSGDNCGLDRLLCNDKSGDNLDAHQGENNLTMYFPQNLTLDGGK
ncbi:MAG: hypothetical protein K9J37_02750 [Saprospiraceae bacterium]|nr:hypothetical protein [Saprospiraceae bacterium]MCF8248800.1 hypothetical protein [Saprospiraceae bacterium]MCF8279909.1 hypothetical protein [Bacteroidales bacterium]MCF8310085.1 hypothetical protein [Saprospiraceae bacterium]MCF8438985.1 hypothetical protein [Saprospiraceae bacterium]